jgi:uncharacterized membrane protein
MDRENEKMEVCILKFDGSRDAEKALHEVIDAEADRKPWLHEIGVLARPLIGRVRVVASFPDGKSKTFHEGDLADAVAAQGAFTGYYLSALAGPIGSMIGSVRAEEAAGAAGSDLESRLFHLPDIKRALPRDSSALFLMADPKTCDAMVSLFKVYDPEVVRRAVVDELRKRLEALHASVARMFAGIEPQPEAAPH